MLLEGLRKQMDMSIHQILKIYVDMYLDIADANKKKHQAEQNTNQWERMNPQDWWRFRSKQGMRHERANWSYRLFQTPLS